MNQGSVAQATATLLSFSAWEPCTKSATTSCPLALSSSKTRPMGRGKLTFTMSLDTPRLLQPGGWMTQSIKQSFVCGTPCIVAHTQQCTRSIQHKRQQLDAGHVIVWYPVLAAQGVCRYMRSVVVCCWYDKGQDAVSKHLSNTKVLGEVLAVGPTSMRSRSPEVPASTGQGVYDTGRNASSPFLSRSGTVPSGLWKYTPVAGSSNTCMAGAVAEYAWVNWLIFCGRGKGRCVTDCYLLTVEVFRRCRPQL